MSHRRLASIRFTLLAAVWLVAGSGAIAVHAAPGAPPAVASSPAEPIAPYQPRFGRQRPVIAVIGANSGTELTDFVVPYGILRAAGVGEVVAVGTGPGPMTMRPALRIQPQASIAAFDARFPEGADYVVVPAVVHRDDPVLIDWIKLQAAKGATLVSICDGALVLAASGVMNGHRATAHWATDGYRRKTYPEVRWVNDRRYVADGRIVSSAGISAAIPTALALVEAIAGPARAAAVAADIGTNDWSAVHDSRRFHPRFGRNLTAFATTQYLNGWFHRPQIVGIPIGAGVDEIALALAADAYTRTGRAHAYALATNTAPVPSLHGLTLLPDDISGGLVAHQVMLASGKPAGTLDRVLADIASLYGKQTAYGVALDLEYPDFYG